MNRTRWLLTLLLGVGLGYGLHWLRPQEPVTEPPTPIIEEKLPSHIVEAPQPAAPRLETKVENRVAGRKFQEVRGPTALALRPVPLKNEPAEQIRGFYLREDTVQEMERHARALPQYAVAESMSDGWRIEIKPEDQVFRRAGLATGDIITFESLQSQYHYPERRELARRFESLLRSIER